MPGQKRSDSFNLKHRLTGAAILIGFAVIVLPMLLGGPPDTGGGQVTQTAGDSETRVFRSNITPIGGATPNAQNAGGGAEARADPSEARARPENAGAAAGTDTADAANAQDRARKTETADQTDEAAEQQTAPAQKESPEKETRTASSDSGQTVDRGWIVQVGTFKNPDNVDKLVAQLKNSGFGTSTSEVDTSEGSATRVWVGPYATRVEAARIKTRVKQKTGTEGLIVAYP